MVFVDVDSPVDSGGADVEALLVPFFLAILLKSAKFFCVNRDGLIWCLLSIPLPLIDRFCNSVDAKDRSCSSNPSSGGVVDGRLRPFGCCSVYTSRQCLKDITERGNTSVAFVCLTFAPSCMFLLVNPGRSDVDVPAPASICRLDRALDGRIYPALLGHRCS